MALIIWRQRHRPGGATLALMLVAMGVWALGSTLEFTAGTLEAKDFWVKLGWLGIANVPVLVLLSTLHLTGHVRALESPLLPLLWIVPLGTVIAVLTNNWVHLMWRSVRWASPGSLAVVYDFGPWFWVHMAFTYVTITTASVLFIVSLIKRQGVFRWQAVLALCGLGLPVIANGLYVSDLGPGVDLTPTAFGATGLVIALCYLRFRLLDLSPVAYDKVVESIQDGIMVLDDVDQVVDINPAALKVLGVDRQAAIGNHAREVFAKWPGAWTRLGDVQEAEYEIEVQNGGSYNLRVSRLIDHHDRRLGRAIVLYDVGEYKRMQAAQQHATQQIEQQRRISEGLRRAMLALSKNLDHTHVVAEILVQLKEVIHYDRASLLSRDEDHLYLVDGSGLDDRSIDATIPLDADHPAAQCYRNRQLVMISDLYAGSDRQPLPGGHEARSVLAAPMVAGQQMGGVLVVDRFQPQSFTLEESQILQAFANQAAIVMQNAQLHLQAQEAAAVEERNRLAQDLHDAVMQTLFSASLIAEVTPGVWEKDREQARRGLEELRLLTQSALAEMRTLLFELRPADLETRTIGELLKHVTDTVSSRARIPVEMVVGNDCHLPVAVQTAFYRIAQEAFNNVEKHASASRVVVKLDAQPKTAVMSIIDNGCGFDVGEVLPGHLGLGIMHNRARAIGARLNIFRHPGGGTQVELRWSKNRE